MAGKVVLYLIDSGALMIYNCSEKEAELSGEDDFNQAIFILGRLPQRCLLWSNKSGQFVFIPQCTNLKPFLWMKL